MNGLLHEIRHAFRQMRRSPAFACTAILILALGMCASVSIFAFVDAALLKPLPYPESHRLVDVTGSVPMLPRANLSYPDYLDWKKLNHVFTSLDVYHRTGYLLRTGAGAEPVPGVTVSDGFFRTLRIAPLIGRDFYDGEDLPAAPRTVLLSYHTWKNRFGERTTVLGETVTLSGIANTIIGVLPQEFQFAPKGDAEFWTTLHASDPCGLRRSCHNLNGIARLKDGISVATALADMQAIARQLELQYPGDNRGQGASVALLSQVIVADIRSILLVLLSGAILLLAIACINVSSLLLVRSESRKREIAVRVTLGASPARLIWKFIVEGVVLVALASALGLLTAYSAMQFLARLISKSMLSGMPYLQGLGLNWHVLGFAVLIATFAAILFALAPLMRVPLARVQEGLAEGGRGSAGVVWRRFGANLVVVELAIAVVLLVGAGLLGKSFYRLLRVDLCFQPEHLATVDIALPETEYPTDERTIAAGRQIIERISSLPGVKSAGVSSVLPVSFNGNTDWIRIVGQPYNGEHNEVNERVVSSAFFTTLQARLFSGRFFTDAEDASKPKVVVINQALARKYLPGEDPIGKRMGDTALSPNSIKEIIGVVEDIRDGSLDSEIWPAVYYPFNQGPESYFSMVVRASENEKLLLPTLVATIHQIDPGIGTINEATMSARINDSSSAYLHRSSAWLVGGFAAIALLLGVVGLYSVIAYSVSRRTREIGVRMALGAQRSAVYRLVMREAAWLTGFGIASGLVCSIAAATLIRGLLFGVQALDLITFTVVSVLLAVAGLGASYLPARRAAQVDPIVALRYE
jgi:macrolide transport system ATP-binding/permease protein